MSKQDTENKILDAAFEIFSDQGFKASTTKGIADKAQVNEVTLFRYFGSKEKLFLAVLDREARMRLDIFDQEWVPSENMVDDLTKIGQVISQKMVKEASFSKLCIQEINTHPVIFNHVRTIPLTAIAKLVDYFDSAKNKGYVRDDIDSEAMAVGFFSFMFRILISHAFLGDDLFMDMDRDESIKQFAEIFVNGVIERGDA